MTRTLLAAAVALMLAGPAWAEPDERKLAATTDKMLRWIERKTDYSIEGFEVKIIYRSSDELWRMFFGDQPRPDDTFQVHAAHINGTIILDEEFRIGLDDAFLFHELVHLVQHHNGAEFPCQGLREKEAYDLQHEYAHAFSGYIINDFFQLPFSSCGDW